MSDVADRLRSGDVSAVDDFYREYGRRVFAVARRIVGNPWDAEELVQDVTWIVYRKIDSYRGDGNFWGWVYRITENCARIHLRKQKRVPVPVDSAELDRGIERLGVVPKSPLERLEFKRVMGMVQQEIEGVEEVNRDLLTRVCMGDSLREAGSRHDLSDGAVKSRIHRTRLVLRERVQTI